MTPAPGFYYAQNWNALYILYPNNYLVVITPWGTEQASAWDPNSFDFGVSFIFIGKL